MTMSIIQDHHHDMTRSIIYDDQDRPMSIIHSHYDITQSNIYNFCSCIQ